MNPESPAMQPEGVAVRLYDAHNHLQDERLAPHLEEILKCLGQEQIQRFVVNGSSEEDWEDVLKLARRIPEVIPSFGYHPWYVKERAPNWLPTLRAYLEKMPAAVGEIGLDRWVKGHDIEDQKVVFVEQLRLAAEKELPVSIHCLQAWGLLLELLKSEPRPKCGFVLHSFGGPREMIDSLAELGAYFSLPGYFAHERKTRQREAFQHVPKDRLLIETDAPDQCLPESRVLHSLPDLGRGTPVNHPANMRAVYEFAAELYCEPLVELVARVETNFCRVFNRWFPKTVAPYIPVGSGGKTELASPEC
jgi:TatD DNase family protein